MMEQGLRRGDLCTLTNCRTTVVFVGWHNLGASSIHSYRDVAGIMDQDAPLVEWQLRGLVAFVCDEELGLHMLHQLNPGVAR